METVIIVIHLMVIVALIAVVLMQRSEGGALGIGGGGGGNFMSARGTGNVLTRTTAILAAAFFATSIILTVLTRFGDRPSSILDNVPAQGTTQPAPIGGSQDGSVLDQLDQMAPAPSTTEPAAPQVPQ